MGRCLRARPKVTQIAGIFTIGDDGKAFGFGQRGELREELVLAEIAAIVRVAEVFGIVEFAGANDAHGKLETCGQAQGVLELTPR